MSNSVLKTIIIVYTIILIDLMILYALLYRRTKKTKTSSKSKYLTKENKLITEILDLSIKSSENPIKAINNKLIEFYNFDYCSIYENSNGKLYYLDSNVNTNYNKKLTEYCNEMYNGKIDGHAILKTSENCLDYPSARERGIKYSYFFKLGRIGAILIENKSTAVNKEIELEIFSVIIKNITITLQNLLYQHKLQTLAMRDNLTKVYNRNYMELQINDLIKKDEVFSLAMMDIDKFKSFNDTYGHKVGDIVLVETSKLIKEMLSSEDEIYRWGGEEFVILFNNQDTRKALSKLERIRKNIQANIINDENAAVPLKVTVSFGVVGYKSGYDIDTMLKLADKALYYCKENGRNQCAIYDCNMMK